MGEIQTHVFRTVIRRYLIKTLDGIDDSLPSTNTCFHVW